MKQTINNYNTNYDYKEYVWLNKHTLEFFVGTKREYIDFIYQGIPEAEFIKALSYEYLGDL